MRERCPRTLYVKSWRAGRIGRGRCGGVGGKEWKATVSETMMGAYFTLLSFLEPRQPGRPHVLGASEQPFPWLGQGAAAGSMGPED